MKHRSLSALVWLLMSVTLSGCFPVAWVMPPAKLDVGTGVARTTYEPTNPDVAGRHKASGLLDVRGSVAPLGAIPGFEARFVDVSAGYGMRYNWSQRHITRGPFVGLSVHVPRNDSATRRLTLGSQFHVITDNRRKGNSIAGTRVTGRVGYELSSWVDGVDGGCSAGSGGGFCGRGYGFGEFGLSPYVEVARAQFARSLEWTWTVGFTIRFPMSIGGGIVLFNPASLL